jgi:hypothetical protein
MVTKLFDDINRRYQHAEIPTKEKMISYSLLSSEDELLIAFLLIEKRKGTDSFWWPYIKVLPDKVNNLSLFSQQEILLLDDEDFEEQTARLVHEARVRESMRTGKPYDDKLEIPLEQIRLITPNGNPQPGDPELYGKPGSDAPEPEPETDDEPNEKALAR